METSKKIYLLILASLAAIFVAILLNRVIFASKTVAYGCFHQVAHKGRGCVALVQNHNGQMVLRLSDFETTQNGDLHILLISADDALENETVKNSEQLYIARLEKTEGFQEFVVPDGKNLANFHSVVIWNKKHGVNFTTAPLKRF